ncbi:MAG: PrgI family protein [Candidatus Niyogibacteria bacterium]|nr:PrgI family protein [Candidatus Niyogibacteria bacterium]
MRQFSVPQFIEVEDKIFGPLTLKQFIYVLGGAASIFIIYVFFGVAGVIFLGLPVGVLAAALAFYKVNNQPFISLLANALSFYAKSKLYIWKKRDIKKSAAQKTPEIKKEELVIPKITEGKLKDLAWSLDVKEKIK